MIRARFAPLLVGAILFPWRASAQIPVPTPVVEEAPPPVVETESVEGTAFSPGAIEVQLGIAGLVLPEESDGMFSAQPELRVGLFLSERMELQGEASVRVWPLGTVAANSYTISGNLLLFPGPSSARARFFILGGGGGAFTDPPGPEEGRSFDPLVRGGTGVRLPLAGLGVPFLNPLTFAVEYRGELVFADDTDIVTGISLGISRFL